MKCLLRYYLQHARYDYITVQLLHELVRTLPFDPVA